MAGNLPQGAPVLIQPHATSVCTPGMLSVLSLNTIIDKRQKNTIQIHLYIHKRIIFHMFNSAQNYKCREEIYFKVFIA